MVPTRSLRSGLVKRLGNANWHQWVAAGVLTATMLGGLTVWATVNHGSVGRCLLVWNGIRVHVPTPVVSFDTLQEGRTYEAKVGIENLGSSPVQLTGFNSSCDCVAPGYFPVTLAGRSRLELAVSYTPEADQAGPKLLRIFTSDPATPELAIKVIAKVITPDPSRVDKTSNPDPDPILKPIDPAPPGGG
jgi:Protein of unknown function (DUF1573)